MDQEKQNNDVLSQLIWQVEAGADEAIEEQAGMLHWQTRQTPVAATSARGLSAEALETALSPDQKTTLKPASRRASRAIVDTPPAMVQAASLSELQSEVESFTGCGLKQTAMHLVFADGNADADLMLIGDAPAEDDDRQGKPFMGTHGVLLNKMLASIGLSRDKAYMTNMVFWRPPGGRSPTQEEIDSCLPFVHKHIMLVKPKVIVCLGTVVTKSLLHKKESFSKVRGKWFEYRAPLEGETTQSIPCLPTHPPAYLLRLPISKRQAWQDLLNLKDKLNT